MKLTHTESVGRDTQQRFSHPVPPASREIPGTTWRIPARHRGQAKALGNPGHRLPHNRSRDGESGRDFAGTHRCIFDDRIRLRFIYSESGGVLLDRQRGRGIGLQRNGSWRNYSMARLCAGYVTRVWPTFDWETTFKAFIADYGKYLRGRRAGTHARAGIGRPLRCGNRNRHALTAPFTNARASRYCGTSFAASRRTRLATSSTSIAISRSIRAGKSSVATMWRKRLLGRIAEVRRDDAECAFRHVFAGRFPESKNDEQRLRSWSENVYRMVKQHYPYPMAVKMLLTPLDLPPRVKPLVGAPLAFTVRLIMWGF